jgi:hypothetical protein
MKPIYAHQIAAHLVPGACLSAFQYMEIAGHTQQYLQAERRERDKYIYKLDTRDTTEMDERAKARLQAQIYHQQNRQNNDAALSRVVVDMAAKIQKLEAALNDAVTIGRRYQQERHRAIIDADAYRRTIQDMTHEIEVLTEIAMSRLPAVPVEKEYETLKKDLNYWSRMNDVLMKNDITLTF